MRSNSSSVQGRFALTPAVPGETQSVIKDPDVVDDLSMVLQGKNNMLFASTTKRLTVLLLVLFCDMPDKGNFLMPYINDGHTVLQALACIPLCDPRCHFMGTKSW